jgi:hypothetical protein
VTKYNLHCICCLNREPLQTQFLVTVKRIDGLNPIEDNVDWNQRNTSIQYLSQKNSIILVLYSLQYPAYTNTSIDSFGRSHAWSLWHKRHQSWNICIVCFVCVRSVNWNGLVVWMFLACVRKISADHVCFPPINLRFVIIYILCSMNISMLLANCVRPNFPKRQNSICVNV